MNPDSNAAVLYQPRVQQVAQMAAGFGLRGPDDVFDVAYAELTVLDQQGQDAEARFVAECFEDVAQFSHGTRITVYANICIPHFEEKSRVDAYLISSLVVGISSSVSPSPLSQSKYLWSGESPVNLKYWSSPVCMVCPAAMRVP